MLPFLKPKRLAATIIQKVKPNGESNSESEENNSSPMAQLIDAIHSKNEEKAMEALKQLMSSMSED